MTVTNERLSSNVEILQDLGTMCSLEVTSLKIQMLQVISCFLFVIVPVVGYREGRGVAFLSFLG